LIAVDTNVLVYAHREETAKHEATRRRLIELAEGSTQWAIPVFCVSEFLRVITHRRIFDPPFPVERAVVATQRLLESPSLTVLLPGERHVELFLGAMAEGGASGNLVFDAQIVALCRAAGVSVLLSEDRDFDRFPGLRREGF